MRRPRNSLPLILVSLCLFFVAGCIGPRVHREKIIDSRSLTVTLRNHVSGSEPVDRGYDHPVTISAVRMTHILASLDVRFPAEKQAETKGRVPAIPTSLVYPLGDALAKALAEADSSQEIVVMATRRERSLKIFTKALLTSFIVYMQDDLLHIHLSRIDWELPKNPNATVREPQVGKPVMKFNALPGEAVIVVDPQAVAVDWRDGSFREAASVRVTPGGQVRRRTILMEEPAEEAPEPRNQAEGVQDLAPQTLRRLADLEEERRAGGIPEAEYQRRRRSILAADPGLQ